MVTSASTDSQPHDSGSPHRGNSAAGGSGQSAAPPSRATETNPEGAAAGVSGRPRLIRPAGMDQLEGDLATAGRMTTVSTKFAVEMFAYVREVEDECIARGTAAKLYREAWEARRPQAFTSTTARLTPDQLVRIRTDWLKAMTGRHPHVPKLEDPTPPRSWPLIGRLAGILAIGVVTGIAIAMGIMVTIAATARIIGHST